MTTFDYTNKLRDLVSIPNRHLNSASEEDQKLYALAGCSTIPDSVKRYLTHRITNPRLSRKDEQILNDVIERLKTAYPLST